VAERLWPTGTVAATPNGDNSAFPVGSLIRARGRDWVVLPSDDPQVLVVRPLGGTDDEVTGIYLPLERVTAAIFPPPTADDLGDFHSARLLRDALRLGFRETTAPLRCLAHIAVEPRPYQLVPLLMALRLDPVRLLIADDVGVGKTIEAALIARELLDRGDIERLAVLCPPHLAEQWQRELTEKFHIDAEVVLAGTAARLERDLGLDESLFDRYPYVVVSTDFIKSDQRWQDFVRACPEFVIVDEAHECADQSGARSATQRYRLVAKIAEDLRKHVVLVTATPHSGKEDAFRNLLGFLDPEFRNLPDDLSGEERRLERQRLARHFVQRRRADIVRYVEATTHFPTREPSEETYQLSAEYRDFFRHVLRYCRERVQDDTGGRHRQRVRWWAALGLLRAVGSSPEAAAATLRERARGSDTATVEEADALGRSIILDEADEASDGNDVTPGADAEADSDAGTDGGKPVAPVSPHRRRLLELARAAEALRGESDRKLTRGVSLVKGLLADGFTPIVFCKFIETAEYVAHGLREALAGVEVIAVTGRLPHAEREERVRELAQHPRRVLVATDCLSEGINLQEHFNAVVHYDLAWNPTRHEQREGRVDRFGQPCDRVRTVTLYGADNPIDGIVLDVLLRKQRAIRQSLGVDVPVPESQTVLEAILEGLLFRGRPDEEIEAQLELFEQEEVAPRQAELHQSWDKLVDRERRSRTVFAQEGIKAEEVAAELEVSRRALGSPADVTRFVEEALRALHAPVQRSDGELVAELSEAPQALRDVLGVESTLRIRLADPADPATASLGRTHPLVENLAAFLLDNALDPQAPQPLRVARRAGVLRTRGVEFRTTLLLLRLRFDLVAAGRSASTRRYLAEEAALVAFTGSPEEPTWLTDAEAETILQLTPDANVPPDQARHHLERILAGLPALTAALEARAAERARAISDTYARIRAGTRSRVGGGAAVPGFRAEPKFPIDVLGVYVYVPGA